MILLDTSVLSRAFRRRRPGAVELRIRTAVERLLVSDTPLGLPAIVLQEALSGIRDERRFRDLERRLTGAFTILHPATAEYVVAARLKNTCLARGLNATGIDCLIASQSIAGGHELCALDDDFRQLAKYSALKLIEPEEL